MYENLSRRKLFRHGFKALVSLCSFSILSLNRNRSLWAANDAIANLEAQIPGLMRKALIPGLAVAVIRDGGLYWSQGFGVMSTSSKKAVAKDTVFAAASLNKPIFAYAVLKMVEQGKLDLDAPLTQYTAKPYISDPKIKLVTIRRVLSHTTGFPNWSGDNPLKIEFEPGTKFNYSGEGFLYLQKVVEEITQQPLNEYLNDSLFVPLQMKNSSLIWQSAFQQTASDGHNRNGKAIPMGKPKRASAAGSLRTTAEDYAKFLMAMMKPGSVDSPILTEDSLTNMLQPQIQLDKFLDWGLGWALETVGNERFFWHWGDLVTFKSFTLASRESGDGIVIFTNSQNGLKICRKIVKEAIGGEHPAFDLGMIQY